MLDKNRAGEVASNLTVLEGDAGQVCGGQELRPPTPARHPYATPGSAHSFTPHTSAEDQVVNGGQPKLPNGTFGMSMYPMVMANGTFAPHNASALIHRMCLPTCHLSSTHITHMVMFQPTKMIIPGVVIGQEPLRCSVVINTNILQTL